MNTTKLVTGILLIALFVVEQCILAGESALKLKVMTFNLRYASLEPPNSWPQRRPVVKECIKLIEPDIIGTQEGLFWQLKEMANDLPEYEWFGLGREGGSHSEFMAIFFNKARFELLEYDHFWLSDTPMVIGSSTWGNSNRRMVTWGKFKDKLSGLEFFVWNTHLDHEVQAAREKGARLILDSIKKLNTELPVILTGDFNAVAQTNMAYEILVGPDKLKDSWVLAHKRINEKMNTFHGFSGPREKGERIDWILFKGDAKVDTAEIVTFSRNGQYPSDHFPVVVTLEFNVKK